MPKVVLIKSESDGPDRFFDVLQKEDFHVEIISSIDFLYKNIDKLSDKLKNHSQYDGIVHTSPRAVYCTYEAFKILNNEFMDDWKLKELNYSVGDATSNLIKELLYIETRGKESGNAQKLSSIIIQDYFTKNGHKKLLFPCGNLKQNILEKNLAEHTIELDITEVYETIQHKNLEESIKNLKKVDFLVFFSPSSVNFSLPFFKKHSFNLCDVKVIAIGPSTEKYLANNEIACNGVCETPSPHGLLKVLEKFKL